MPILACPTLGFSRIGSARQATFCPCLQAVWFIPLVVCMVCLTFVRVGEINGVSIQDGELCLEKYLSWAVRMKNTNKFSLLVKKQTAGWILFGGCCC